MHELVSSVIPVTGLTQLLDLVRKNSVRSFAGRSHDLLIDGKWQQARSGRMIEVTEPSTGEAMGTRGGAENVKGCTALVGSGTQPARTRTLPAATAADSGNAKRRGRGMP